MTTTVPTLPARPEAAQPAPPGSHTPRWPRVAVAALLAATAVLYIWGLSRSGWANAFYSAAAQAGGESWKAWFFGSSDAANAITVDKTPAALWVTGLSVRIFGLSSWSVLVPQALMGVASVGLLYAAVKRGRRAGRRADRRGGAGPDPGRGPDLPVQQPGRPARAGADRRGVRDAASSAGQSG